MYAYTPTPPLNQPWGARSTQAPQSWFPVWGAQVRPPPRPNGPAPDRDLQREGGLPGRDKLVVSVDFGTTESGVAYSSSTFTDPRSRLVLNWPGTYEIHRKIPTCLVYDATEPESLKAEASIQKLLPKLPPGKMPLDLVTDFLASLWDHAKQEIIKDAHYTDSELERVEVYLTIPLTWNKEGIAILREAAIKAALVQGVGAGDNQWRDRLHLATEAEASFVHCVLNLVVPPHIQERPLNTGKQFLVCTAGGRSVEISSYKVTEIGSSSIPEIAEMPRRSGFIVAVALFLMYVSAN
ncbi:unnamed protein product [Cyclocybe aegerita]|uniref:Uncharacterized protein n=1 Tax=Cyclocybe aegerita TaxID=1973307 RepID=A0A8S0X4D6_CYCAE|nr:unnamed protein product [Cyclocybe aegerita]